MRYAALLVLFGCTYNDPRVTELESEVSIAREKIRKLEDAAKPAPGNAQPPLQLPLRSCSARVDEGTKLTVACGVDVMRKANVHAGSHCVASDYGDTIRVLCLGDDNQSDEMWLSAH